MQTSCRRCLSLAAGMFGKDYSAGVSVGLGKFNSTTTISRYRVGGNKPAEVGSKDCIEECDQSIRELSMPVED